MFACVYDKLEDEGFKGSESEDEYSEDNHSTESDREEIEQALYAQIHYCQDDVNEEDDKHFIFQCSENGELKNSRVQLEDNEFTIKSPFNDSCITISSGTDNSPSKKKKSKKKRILTDSLDILTRNTKRKKEEVIQINSQTDTEAISISSDIEIDITSDIDYDISSDIDCDIDSDCMLLDESCDDMGDIVLNVDHNQRTMLNNLTVRNIREMDEADKWTIIDKDRFVGNPLLGRYYKSPSVRCHNCNEVGHLSKVCPKPRKIIACYLCGEEGHSGKACANPICFNCNVPGHVISECKRQRRSKYIDCHRCQMFGHTSYECPEIWRQFHLTTVHGPLVRGKDNENSRKHCPNCAGDDHFDHECDEERMDRHSLPSCTLISQYRKSDVRTVKRQKEMQEGETSIPTKKRKIDTEYNTNSYDFKRSRNFEEDFDRSTCSYIEMNDCINSKKKKKKEKEKKPDNFRKMMEMDFYTFEKNTKKPVKKRNSNLKSDKIKCDKRKEKTKKKNNKKMLSLEEEYYGPIPKKKKKHSKKNKKDDKSKKQKTNNRGFKIRDGRFEISFQNR